MLQCHFVHRNMSMMSTWVGRQALRRPASICLIMGMHMHRTKKKKNNKKKGGGGDPRQKKKNTFTTALFDMLWNDKLKKIQKHYLLTMYNQQMHHVFNT